jgi:cyclopropane fatty-acyl-phospholipid synthase-like methyltransferase
MTGGAFRGGAYHDVHLPEHPARARIWEAIAAYLTPWVPPGSRVIEIGAGHCSWINAVRAAERVAVDLWEELPRYAAAGVQTRILDAATELQTLGSSSFDVALASNVLEHFEPDIAATIAAEVHALLRPGGRFIVIQPNFRHAFRNYFDDYTHRSVFTDVSLPNLLRARGFSIEHVQAKFLPYSMRDLRSGVPMWLVRAYLHSPIKPRAGQMLVIAQRR